MQPGHVQQGSGEGSRVGFGAEPGQVQQGSGEGSRFGRVWIRARSGSTGFRRRFQRRCGGLWRKPGQVQQGSGEGLGGFGAEPGQVQQGSGEGSGEGLGGFGAEPAVRFNRFRRCFRRRFQEALVQSQVMFNRVPEKVPEKVWEVLVQSQVRFNRFPKKVREKVWEALVQSYRLGQVQQGSGEGFGEGLGGFGAVPAEVFPALGFAARFRKICKNKTLRLLGIPPIFFSPV